MKKVKNIEMKIYELLGVKVFRKMVFTFRDILLFPLTIKMSKEEKRDFFYNIASNYNLGKIKSLEDIKKFKKYLFINTGIHIWALSVCLPNFLKVIGGTASLFTTITNLTFIGINLYCIMLQRYNGIRINQLIEKMTPRYERQKNKIKEELRKDDSLILEHTYKIVDKKKRETSITFEELIANANIEQLKQHREFLAYFQSMNQAIQENEFDSDKQPVDVSMPMKKHKTLKLELKNNRQHNSANN